jgi:hypothetical protein
MSNDQSPLALPDARVHFVFTRHSWRLASVEEYARAAGVDAAVVLNTLAGPLSQGVLSIETHDGTLFVHTAPKGRNPGSGAKPNLWESLRSGRTVPEAHRVWALIRSLEAAGWGVVWDRDELVQLSTAPPLLGVRVRGTTVPLFHLSGRTDWVGEVCTAVRGDSLAVTSDHHGLDRMVTAVRAWMLSQPKIPTLGVLVLEPPMFAPTLVQSRDNSVTPVVVQRYEPGSLA